MYVSDSIDDNNTEDVVDDDDEEDDVEIVDGVVSGVVDDFDLMAADDGVDVIDSCVDNGVGVSNNAGVDKDDVIDDFEEFVDVFSAPTSVDMDVNIVDNVETVEGFSDVDFEVIFEDIDKFVETSNAGWVDEPVGNDEEGIEIFDEDSVGTIGRTSK